MARSSGKDQPDSVPVASSERRGFVYVLVSPECEFVKIGGTSFPPVKRMRQINGDAHYKHLGPWTLFDFCGVSDWKLIEAQLHRKFAEQRFFSETGAEELFSVPAVAVRRAMDDVPPHLRLGNAEVDKLFGDVDLHQYLQKLFALSGLLRWMDIQGAWTFTLYPSTNQGRYFTINIGTHEVAFSTLSFGVAEGSVHCLVLDRLILDFDATIAWIERRGGGVRQDVYSSALPRAVSVHFEGSLSEAELFLGLDGVRRALIAYWSEALLRLAERGSSSMFARFHNLNAVREIRRRSASPDMRYLIG